MTDQSIMKDIDKNTVRSFLDIVVLVKLRQGKPMNGHEMKHYVKQKFGVNLSPGTFYELLYLLDRKGFLKVTTAAGQRMYKLSEEGTEHINGILELKSEIIRFVDNLLS